MKTESLKRLGVGTLLAILSIAIQPSAQSQTITRFDPPGSIATFPSSINHGGSDHRLLHRCAQRESRFRAR